MLTLQSLQTIPPQFVNYFRSRRWNVPILEIVGIDWAFSGFLGYYVHTNFLDKLAKLRGGLETLALAGMRLETRLQGGHFRSIPRTADISDDSVSIDLWDADRVVTDLYSNNGPGMPVVVYRYFPDLDWLESKFFGLLKRPEEIGGESFKTKVESGFRSASLTLPTGAFYASCPNIFGGQLQTIDDCTENWRCPHDRHLGGVRGNQVLDADGNHRRTCDKTRADCSKFWGSGNPANDTNLPHGGFQTIVQNHIVTQTKGPNLSASVRGNETNLKNPPRVIAGRRRVGDLDVLAYTPEPNTNHPELASIRALFFLSRGPVLSATVSDINGVVPQSNTLGTSQIRLGIFRQGNTSFSNNPASYSGNAVAYVVQNPVDTRGNVPAPTGNAEVYGFARVRKYAADGTLTLGYSTNRGDWLRTLYEDKDFGLGYSRNLFVDSDWATLRDWCNEVRGSHSVTIPAVFDDEGNEIRPEQIQQVPELRSTFNADLQGRDARAHIEDLCRAGFISPPFVHGGKLRVVPIGKVEITEDIPTFTDEGQNRNIIREGATSSLRAKELPTPSGIKLTFDDEAFNWTEIPILISSDRAELAEGLALGAFARRSDPKSFPGFGVTNIYEAERLANLLFAVGPFAQGGDENPLEITFSTWSLLADSVGLYPHQVIRVFSRKLRGAGVPFVERTSKRAVEYFRIKKLEWGGDLKVKVTAQAHPVDFWEAFEDVNIPLPIAVERNIENPAAITTPPLFEEL